ncbi:hypothetical protein WA158_007691 [Blastocystis sp. Blastoise]
MECSDCSANCCPCKIVNGVVCFMCKTYTQVKTYLPKPLNDNLTLAENFIKEKKQVFDDKTNDGIEKIAEAGQKIIEKVLPSDETPKDMNELAPIEKIQYLRTTVTDRIKKIATKSIEEIKEQENVKKALEIADQFKKTVDDIMNPFDEFNRMFIEQVSITCKPAADFVKSYFIDPVRHLVIYYSEYIRELAKKASNNEYYVLIRDGDNLKVSLVQVSNKLFDQLRTSCTDCVGQLKDKMNPYYEHYENLMKESLKIFVDEDGKFTLKQFEELAKTKVNETSNGLKDQLTIEALENLLMNKFHVSQETMDHTFIPISENVKKQYKDVLDLVTDEKGNFTVDKIRNMIGQSADEYMKKASEHIQQNNQDIIKTTSDYQQDGVLYTLLRLPRYFFLLYCYFIIFLLALVCSIFSTYTSFCPSCIKSKEEQHSIKIEPIPEPEAPVEKENVKEEEEKKEVPTTY